MHRRLIQEEAYKEANYEQALKRAFLGTDEDLLAGASVFPSAPSVAKGCSCSIGIGDG